MIRAGRKMGITHEQWGTLGVRLTDEREMSAMHWQFMRERGPTDVLSFPAGPMLGEYLADDGDQVFAEDFDYELDEPGASFSSALGDIAICWPVLCAQANSGHARALLHTGCILGVHGMAHLLGHDHRTRPEARAMHRLECEGLAAIHMPDVPRPYTR